MWSMDTADTSTEAVGMRLAAVREARGYLQGFLAKLLDISQQRLSNYEKGQRVLPHDILWKFCQVTGATSDYILFGMPRGMPMDLLSKITLSPQGNSDSRAS